MICDLDGWIDKLRKKIPLEENELELMCRIVKDIFMLEPNVIVSWCSVHIVRAIYPIIAGSGFYLPCSCDHLRINRITSLF